MSGTLEMRPTTGDTYPQVLHMGPGYDWDAPDSVARAGPGARPPERLNLEAFHLHPEAEPTDLISQGYIYAAGLLVSAAFCAVLAGHDVQPHVAFPAGVVHRGIRHDYRWLQFVDETARHIDYRRSRFNGARIESAEDLSAAARRLSERPGETLKAGRLVFAPDARALDLFCVQLAPRRFFVSEALAAALTAAEMTGFELRPAGTDVVWTGG